MADMTLELTIEEVNLMLESLGQLPYVRVYDLIGKIQAQARQQLGGGAQPEVAAPSLDDRDGG